MISNRYFKKINSFSSAFLGFVVCFFLLFFFRNSDIAKMAVIDGINLCLFSIIPSLFPFLVLSKIILNIKKGRLFSFVSKIIAKIYSVSEQSSSAIIMGLLCGFPVGAYISYELYDTDSISKEECEYLQCVVNNINPAFAIGVIGAKLGDIKLGVLIYIISVFSSFISSLFFRKRFDCKHNNSIKRKKIGFSDLLILSIKSSAKTILLICAFIIFFSSFVGVLTNAISRFYQNSILNSILYGFFEISSGINSLSKINNDFLSFVLSSAIACWSGISCHFQIKFVFEGTKIKMSRFLFSRGIGTLISIILSISLAMVLLR